MTDENTTPEVKERSITKRVAIITLAVLAVLIAVGFLASRTGLDKALLRQRLDAFATTLHERGKQEGRDITLTYKDVAIRGGFSNRHAVIIAPELSVRPLVEEGAAHNPADHLVVRTAEVLVFPKAVDLTKMTISMAQPLEFYEGTDLSRKLLTITSATPLDTDVRQHTQEEVTYAEVEQRIPEKIELTYLREQTAEGPEEATPTIVPVYETLTLTQAPGGIGYSDLAQDGSGLGNARMLMKDVVLTPQKQPEAIVKIGEISSEWNHVVNAKKHHEVTAKLHIGDIAADTAVIPYAPISLAFEVGYEGAAPQTAQDLASIRAQESSFKLHRFALTTKDASLNATADFVASPTDVLPVGMATLSLTNVPYVLAELRTFGLLTPGSEPLVTDVLQLTTGTPMADIKDANIEISRARGGSFAIGKTTFEELFAVVLKHGLQQHPTAAPLPPSPDAKPITTPEKVDVEEGARG